ncbi:helicase RepA family protein [Paracoccus sp. MC1862]|uniref:helicase RepA family protein n=1 Tax=Paracoccus sp. MC1862 TaxID=2760307 RepID=UPI0016022152|nr:helicase RepA family protein [Paracoccus sp. MC1862]
MGAFEMMGALDARHREEHGVTPARMLTGRAGDLAAALIPLGRVKPILKCRYLVKGWLDQGAFSVVYGESNVGKTFLAMDLALHVAAGMDWHGSRVPSGDKWAGPVIYVASEGGSGIHNRVEAMRRDNPELMRRVEERGDFLLLKTGLDLCTSDDSQWLVEAIGTMPRKPSLIVVDTLARAMGNGDENTAKDMGQFVRSVDHLREVTGAHVMVIHHSGKDASKGARGSGSLRAAADTEIELTRDGDTIMAEQRKQRDMPCEGVFAYTLKSVFLGMDDDGDRVTSAVVTPAEAVTRKNKVKLTGTDKIGMQALSDALAKHGERKSGDMFPSNRQCVSLEHWREFCDRHSLSSGEGDSSKRTAFHKLKNRLQDKEIVRIVDGFVWKVEGDDRSQSRGNAIPERENASAAPFPSEQGTPVCPANTGQNDQRSHRSPTVPENAGNAGHAAVPTVPALYKSGNEGTLTQPSNEGQSKTGPTPAPSPATDLAWHQGSEVVPDDGENVAPSPALTPPDPDAIRAAFDDYAATDNPKDERAWR